jgi:hypothetical protein
MRRKNQVLAIAFLLFPLCSAFGVAPWQQRQPSSMLKAATADLGSTTLSTENYDIVKVDLEDGRDYPIYIGTGYSEEEGTCRGVDVVRLIVRTAINRSLNQERNSMFLRTIVSLFSCMYRSSLIVNRYPSTTMSSRPSLAVSRSRQESSLDHQRSHRPYVP